LRRRVLFGVQHASTPQHVHFGVETSHNEVFVANFSKMTRDDADGASRLRTRWITRPARAVSTAADETMKTEWQRRCSLLLKRRIECTARSADFDATRTREHFTALVGKPTDSSEVFEKYTHTERARNHTLIGSFR
jgi:hypothetical protein